MYTHDEMTAYCKMVKPTSDGGFDCLCCVHDDHHPSFHWKLDRAGWIGHCKACGANGATFAKTAGMDISELFRNATPRTERISKEQYYYERNCQDKYIYYRIDDGRQTHIKFRMPQKENGKKDFPQGYDKDNKWVRTLRDIDTSLSVFANVSIEKLKQAAAEGQMICHCEGEKDCRTATRYGLIAFTVGSSGDFEGRKEIFKYVRDAQLVIFGDNDAPGVKCAEKIRSYFESLGGRAYVIVFNELPEGGDLSDFMQTHTKEDLQERIDEAMGTKTLKQKPVSAAVHKDDLVSKLVQLNAAEKYETNDKGFGALYAEVFKDKHRYNSSIRDFMFYDGQRWCEDIEGLAARADAKALSDALVIYSLQKDADYLKRVTPLCNIRNRENMLKDSKDIYYLSNEQLDTDDYLLNVQNGTLDLSGNTAKFIKHNPDMLLSKICNVEYKPAAVCKEWSKFLNEIMQGDKEKIRYLQKIAGLSLTGNTQEETCFILYGSSTRNGKSTFCETLIYMLGEYALTIKPETLAQKQNTDSRQASGDIARLAGCRFVNASEPPKRMLFDTALLKSMLGRDSITARHLYQREFSFIPRFKLVINTNYLPTITDDSVFSSGRINVISFDRHFTPDEQDKDLKNRLRNSDELSGILNWCIEGLQMYRREGLKPPKAVQDATETYRSDSDKVGSFINECLTKSSENSKAKDIYEAYGKWCSDNGYGLENKGNFFQELKTKGLYMARGTVKGKTVKNIVRGYVIDTDFVGIEDEIPPFD